MRSYLSSIAGLFLLVTSVNVSAAQKEPMAAEVMCHTRVELALAGFKSLDAAVKASLPSVKAAVKEAPEYLAKVFPESVISDIDNKYTPHAKEQLETYLVAPRGQSKVFLVTPDGILLIPLEKPIPDFDSAPGTTVEGRFEVALPKGGSRFLNLRYARDDRGVSQRELVGRWNAHTYKKVSATLDNSDANKTMVHEDLIANLAGIEFSLDVKADADAPQAAKDFDEGISKKDKLEAIVGALDLCGDVNSHAVRTKVAEIREKVDRQLKAEKAKAGANTHK